MENILKNVVACNFIIILLTGFIALEKLHKCPIKLHPVLFYQVVLILILEDYAIHVGIYTIITRE